MANFEMTSCRPIRRAYRRRKRYYGPLQAVGLFAVLCTLFLIVLLSYPEERLPSASRSLLQLDIPEEESGLLETLEQSFDNGTDGPATTDQALFPPELFTDEQLKKGAILLHILGMVYMFVALAIVCDEFFVPSLDVIIEKLEISEDVAGATFMAAGGSAPELFTSAIGVFISFDDVGIGTIVGSAVFNILFVIAMCVLFSKTVLELTWWPMFRDFTFYSIALLMLVLFFLDGAVYWWEALLMFAVYIMYCSFMKLNERIEHFVKRNLYRNKVTRVCSTDQLVPIAGGPTPSHGTGDLHQTAVETLHPVAPMQSAPRGRRPSVPVLHSGTKFRQGLLQLMIHTIDPLHDGKVDEKATQLHAIASLKVLLDATKPQNGRVESYRSDGLSVEGRPDIQSHVSGRSSQATEVTQADSFVSSDMISQPGGVQANGDVQAENTFPNNVSYGTASIYRVNSKKAAHLADSKYIIPEATSPDLDDSITTTSGLGDETEIPKPIDLSFPKTWRKRLTYIFIAPLIFPLWITLPDVRTPRGKKYYFWSFLGSIMWIAIFSYMMVWWASVVGKTFGISPPVMGLTILAAGTSVPDLITSVIVARKGFGDMAVSSSVGSNIFDVCCGLPIPWLLYALFQLISNFIKQKEDPWHVEPIYVNSTGMACSIMLLFSMLMFVLIAIICSRWKMNKGLGGSMFVLYIAFVGISLGFEYDYFICPI